MGVNGLDAGATAAPVCHDAPMPMSSLDFRRALGPDLRGLGITGFGRTQPYRDATISTLLGTDVSLVVREHDDLAVEVGAEVPLPAEPTELARFNALVAHVAAHFAGTDETAVRARLLQSVLTHAGPGAWTETDGAVVIGYTRAADALLAKLRLQSCK